MANAKPAPVKPTPASQALVAITRHAEEDTPGSLAVTQVHARIQKIQLVMKDLMKPGVHYGEVPGTGAKKSLWSPGADLLGVTFQIALDPTITYERLDDDECEYRVRMVATSQESGRFLGASEGQASTREKKYRWRRPYSLKEWEATDPTRRRITWTSDGEQKHVRQEPGDVSNTILQMAIKRGKVSCIRIVTGCSDIFAQNLEDLPDHLRDGEDEGGKASGPADPRAPVTPAADARPAIRTCHCQLAPAGHPWADGCPPEPAVVPQAAAPAAPQAPAAPAPAQDTPQPVQAPPSAQEAVPVGIPGENPNGTLKPIRVLASKKVKQGTSDKGPWTLYAVETEDGNFITYSSTDAGIAQKALDGNQKVFIRSKDVGRRHREIVEIGVAG